MSHLSIELVEFSDIDVDVVNRGKCFLDQPITYFVQGINGGPIKIGRSQGHLAFSRLSSLQTGNPNTLHFTRVIRRDYEGILHRHFAEFRIRGEWFEPSPEVNRIAHGRAPNVLTAHDPPTLRLVA